MLPALRDGFATAAAVEDDAFDMDVSAIHQGFLRQLQARGGVLALRNRAGRIARVSDSWHVETSSGAVFQAGVVVNASGAWGNEIAEQFGETSPMFTAACGSPLVPAASSLYGATLATYASSSCT